MGQYFSRLDGIRGVAILGVLIAHLLPIVPYADFYGHAGVRLFFVLSGFLITRILISYRGARAWKAAKVFFWNRALRLFPAYYLMLAVLMVTGMVGTEWPYHALYLSNLLYAASGQWSPAMHFWSLAVEEQFYLAWFAVVICAPKRWLVPTALAMLAISPLWRAMTFGGPGNPTVLTPAVIDSLAAGSLLGWASLERPAVVSRLADWRILAASAGAYILLFDHEVWLGTAIALFGVALIALAVSSNAALLDAAPLRHLGRISYGAYLLHLPIYAALPLPPPQRAVAAFLLTIGLAALSWRYFERPILRARHHQIVELDVVAAGPERREGGIASASQA